MVSNAWPQRILFLLGVMVAAMPFLGFPVIVKTIFFIVAGLIILGCAILWRLSEGELLAELAEVLSRNSVNSSASPMPATPVSSLFMAEPELEAVPLSAVGIRAKAKSQAKADEPVAQKTVRRRKVKHESVETI